MAIIDLARLAEIKKLLTEPFAGNSNFQKYHFSIGRQIHTSQYFYDKYYFQLHQENQFIAQLLFSKLLPLKEDLNDLTLVGVNGYSGQMLSQTVIKLKELTGSSNINYALLDYTNKKYNFLFTPEIHRNVVIVVPITYTYSRCFDIENYLKREGLAYLREPVNELGKPNKVNIHPEFIAVFLIYDSFLRLQQISDDDPLTINDLKKKCLGKAGREGKLAELYQSFGWEAFTKERIFFSDETPFAGHTGTHLIQFSSELNLGEKCEHCFPALAAREKLLLPTKSNYDAPNIIFNLPRFKDDFGAINDGLSFHQVLENKKDSGHLFGHLKIDSNIFLHYIERDRFYENNKDQILDFFDSRLEMAFGNKRTNVQITFLIITPTNLKVSTILDDLLERRIFPPTRTTVIYADPRTDFIENFLSNKLPEDLENSIVIYFDYVISGGKNFKLLSDYLKCARDEDHGFDALLTINDRTTYYSKQEIMRKLSFQGRIPDRFIAFFKLNLPIADPANLGDPVEKQNRLFRAIFRSCNLDGLKLRVIQKLNDGKPREFPELKGDNVILMPSQRMVNLMKLRVGHEISNWFFNYIGDRDPRWVEFSIDDLKLMIQNLCEVIGEDNHNFDSEDLTEIIVKTLTHSPFNYYNRIYTATYDYVKSTLLYSLKYLKKNQYRFKDPHHLQTMRDYLQRAVELNSSFMISSFFFNALKCMFEQPENAANGTLPDMMTILLFIKQLTYQNPTRSLKLEELINSPQNLPAPILNTDMDILSALKDRFYLMGRLIKAENSYVLYSLKKQFVSDIGNNKLPADLTEDLINIQEYINQEYLTPGINFTNRAIRNFQNFLKYSKEFNGQDKSLIDLKNSEVGVASRQMLLTIYRLRHASGANDRSRFIQEARNVLQSATAILGNDLEYALCFEYAESKPATSKKFKHRRSMADNIYVIRSSDEHNQPFLNKQGMINQMLSGLDNGDAENVQTFIVLIKDENGKFLSFNDTYQCRKPGEIVEGTRVAVQEAFSLDIRNGQQGIIERSAQMVLLIRLAAITIEDATGKNGNAVLAISTSEAATTANFTRFINVEKIRLLLLVKHEMLDYIDKQFKNDAFNGWVKDREDLNYKNGMSHMLSKYFAAMEYFWRLPRDLNEEDKTILKFLEKKIERHMLSISEQDQQVQQKIDAQEKDLCTEFKLRELFTQLMIVPHLARAPLKEGKDYELKLSVGEGFRCYAIVLEQIIPEIIINMRRYSIDAVERPRMFVITLDEGQLSFRNPFSPKHNPDPKRDKERGGKAMCNLILERYHMEPLTELLTDADHFVVKLNLNTPQ